MKEEGRNVSILSNVYFRLYGDRTYILNLSSGKSYLFNEMVYDILTIIKENPGIDSDKLCCLPRRFMRCRMNTRFPST